MSKNEQIKKNSSVAATSQDCQKFKKRVSYWSRTTDNSTNTPCIVDDKPRRTLVFKQEVNEKTGRVYKKSEYKTVDRNAEMKNYRVSDFSIERLNAIGASLTPTKLNLSSMQAHSQISNALSNLKPNNE